ARRQWLQLAAACAAAAVLGSGTTYLSLTNGSRSSRADEVVANHVRSLLVEDRVVDVPSSDEHTVKPWFNGKLDFAPPVVDLTSDGFPLVGGRLDYAGQRTVAALVYRHRQHIINLFLWPADDGGGRGSAVSGRAPAGRPRPALVERGHGLLGRFGSKPCRPQGFRRPDPARGGGRRRTRIASLRARAAMLCSPRFRGWRAAAPPPSPVEREG